MEHMHIVLQYLHFQCRNKCTCVLLTQTRKLIPFLELRFFLPLVLLYPFNERNVLLQFLTGWKPCEIEERVFVP